jgi:hypothetical protein
MKVKVAIVNTVGRVVTIDPDATNGARIGANLFMPNGSLADPASLRTYLNVGEAGEGIRDHRLLRGLLLGDDHPQYTQWVQAETITGQWQFSTSVWGRDGSAATPSFTNTGDINTGVYFPAEDQVGVSTGGVLRWDVNSVRVFQSDVPLIIQREVNTVAAEYVGIQVNGHNIAFDNYFGFELRLENAITPTDNDGGVQIGFWEGGPAPVNNIVARAPDVAGTGYRWRMEGSTGAAADMVFYSHLSSATGAEIYRHARDRAQMLFVNGTAAAPTIAIGNYTSGLSYEPINGRVQISANGVNACQFDDGIIRPNLPIRGGDQSAASPLYSFINASNAGVYYTGAAVGFSFTGTVRWSYNATAINSSVPYRGANGTAAAPTFAYASAVDGMYLSGTNTVGVSTNSTLRLSVSTTTVTTTLPVVGANGTAAAPTFSYSGTPTSGMYLSGTNTVGISTSSTLRWSVSTTAITSTLQLLGQDGTAAAPSYSFTNSTGLGGYRVAADQFGIATAGVLRLDVSTTAITSTLQWLGQNGTALLPAGSFSGDPNTGWYNFGADDFAIAAGAVQIARFRLGGTTRSVEVGDGTNSANLIFNAAAGQVRDFFYQSAGLNRWGFRVNATAESGSGAGSDLEILRRADAGAALGTAVRITRSTGQWLFEDGTVGAPELSYASDPDTGRYRIGANNMGDAVGGALVLEYAAARVRAYVPVRLPGYTVATLPAGAAGDTAYVTDALAPAFGAAVAGGGAVTIPVFYDGAAWIVG